MAETVGTDQVYRDMAAWVRIPPVLRIVALCGVLDKLRLAAGAPNGITIGDDEDLDASLTSRAPGRQTRQTQQSHFQG